MPADEVTHHRDGLVRVRAGLLDEAVAGTREVDALDLATGLLVGANERLGDRGGHVVVELRLSDPDRRPRPGFARRPDARDTGRGPPGPLPGGTRGGGGQPPRVQPPPPRFPPPPPTEPRPPVPRPIKPPD